MRLSDADCERLRPAFQRAARHRAMEGDPDDFLGEMWLWLVEFCHASPDQVAALLALDPRQVAARAASAARSRYLRRERRRDHEPLEAASHTPAPELVPVTVMLGRVAQALFNETGPEALAIVAGFSLADIRGMGLSYHQGLKLRKALRCRGGPL